MNRRSLLKWFASLPAAALASQSLPARAGTVSLNRVRPGEPLWPSAANWENLGRQVGGRLIKPQLPYAACAAESGGQACANALAGMRNPFYIGDQAGATQLAGWTSAWTSTPSAYAVAAANARDVAAAVNFARQHRLRLVVKGGGHSYQGTSNAADSLLIWTRALNRIALHDAFVARNCPAKPQAAVSVGAGAVWMDVYDAVTTRGGRYVQGGGCATVGVAGLIQSGGFGSFSKRYGLAAAGLLEAEIVTADGLVRIANACSNPDLFWAIKGGGGGSFGVVTRLTLATHELPEIFGDISVRIKAGSDAAFRLLIGELLRFYRERLFNAHWGENIVIRRNNVLALDMVFQDLDQEAAAKPWHEFIDHLTALSSDIALESPFAIEALPARLWWDADYLEKYSPGSALRDPRPGAPRSHAWWTGDNGQVGSFIHGYQSAWLPAALLEQHSREQLADALFAASRHWSVGLHCNKGLAGAPPGQIAQLAGTAINPEAAGAFALAIISAEGPAHYENGVAKDSSPADAAAAAAKINEAMAELKKIAPGAGSYVSESDYFEDAWQQSFWGSNYPRLLSVKRKYDPGCLFFVRHGVGSELWSDDGFTHQG